MTGIGEHRISQVKEGKRKTDLSKGVALHKSECLASSIDAPHLLLLPRLPPFFLSLSRLNFCVTLRVKHNSSFLVYAAMITG